MRRPAPRRGSRRPLIRAAAFLPAAAIVLAPAILFAPAVARATTPEIRAAVTATTLAYRDAWRANHREAVMETMTPDAVIVPSGREPIRGDAAISEFFWPKAGPETTVTAMEQTIESIEGVGDLAVVTGQGLLSFTWQQEGRTESRTQRSTFVNVIRRMPDGDWKITMRSWSDQRAPAPGAAPPTPATAAPAPVAPPPSVAPPPAASPPAAPLSAAPYDSAWPQFSADGRSLVFASTREEGDWEIHVMQVDGTGARRLTQSPGRDAHPYYTRDRKGILFQSPRDGGGVAGEVDLYAMDLDGGNVRRWVADPGFDGVPVPAPAGVFVAYMHGTRAGDGYHWEIRIADTRGRRGRTLTRDAWSSQTPSWSPDGRRIAVFADPQGRDQLFILDAESGKPTPLAASPAADRVPTFSPDGRSVAFTSTRDDPAGGRRDLYRVEVATGAVRRLTNGLDVSSQPAWSPDGRRIAFSAKRQGGVEEIFLLELEVGTPIRLTRGAEGWRSDDPRFDVEAAVQEYARLARSMDPDRLAAAHENNGALVIPGAEPLVGRDAIRKYVAARPGVRVTASSMSTSATELFGDTAIVRGDYAGTVVVGDKPPAEHRGRFVSEWGRLPNGRWLVRRMLAQPSGS